MSLCPNFVKLGVTLTVFGSDKLLQVLMTALLGFLPHLEHRSGSFSDFPACYLASEKRLLLIDNALFLSQ